MIRLLLILLLTGTALAGPSERDYARAWCLAHGGEPEVRLADGTRADCLTTTHAIEVERAAKWTQALGQALHYAHVSRRQPGIVLIIEREPDRYRQRLLAVLAAWQLSIDVWEICPPGGER